MNISDNLSRRSPPTALAGPRPYMLFAPPEIKSGTGNRGLLVRRAAPI
jgi:hypothetical protein